VEIALQTFVNGLALGGTYALLAIGLAMIFSVLGLINFAHGELITITGYALIAGIALGLPFLIACLLAILAAAVASVIMERVAFRPLRGASMEILLLASFAVGVVLQVLFSIFISSRPVPVPAPAIFRSSVSLGPVDIGVLQLIAIGATIVLVTALSLFLRRSALGTSIRAAGVDFEMAQLAGVRANSMFVLAFALSGLLAGVAGILWVVQRGAVDPTMGIAPVLAAFLATVVGGLGNIGGAAVGGIIFGMLQVILEQVLPVAVQPYREAILVSLVVVVLLFRPNGVLSRGSIASAREA
jgi:branched-chain amino acid transport system permease protein